MVVAVIALVMAMTGTGIAAKSLLIDGSQIKNGTITGDKLAPGTIKAAELAPYTITPKGFSTVVLPWSTAVAKASATQRAKSATRTAHSASRPPYDEGTLCPDGDIVVNSPCSPPAEPGPAGPTGPAGSAGSAGSAGQPGASAGTSGTARFTVPEGNPIVSVQFASPVGTGTTAGETPPSTVATATPSVLTELSNISHKMVKSGTKKPRSVEVFLWENGKEGGVFCELTPPSKESCTFPGPIVLEAGVTFALGVVTNGIFEPPSQPAGWEPYELSVGYTTNTIS
jgi:hypothetical protein